MTLDAIISEDACAVVTSGQASWRKLPVGLVMPFVLPRNSYACPLLCLFCRRYLPWLMPFAIPPVARVKSAVAMNVFTGQVVSGFIAVITIRFVLAVKVVAKIHA